MVDLNSDDASNRRLEAALQNLQPLRDLARNWDVDIATCLEEYLEEIVGHLAPANAAVEDEKSEGPPNFSQAALLLQNSSNVYSRKVEYLYSLVYAALDDLISSTGQASKQQSHRKTNADASIDEFNAFDPDLQFLLLDDVLPTDDTEQFDKINMLEEDRLDLHSEFGCVGDIDTTLASIASQLATTNATRLSLGELSVTRLDRSATNEPSAAVARALMGSLFHDGSDTGGGNLRLLNGRCDVGDSGILVMPGTAILGIGTRDRDTVHVPGDDSMDLVVPHHDGDFFESDDNNDGMAFEMTEQDSEPPAIPEEQCVRESASAKPTKAHPWSLLDPDDMGTSKPRPLRIGVTFRLPAEVDETPSNCVTGAHTRRNPVRNPARSSVGRQQQAKAMSTFFTAIETFKSAVANEKRRRSNSIEDECLASGNDMANESSLWNAVVRPTVPLTGLAFGDEFEYIAKATAKRRAAVRRERQRLQSEEPQDMPARETTMDPGFDYDGGFHGDGDDESCGGVYDDFHKDNNSNGPLIGNTGTVWLEDAFTSKNGFDKDTSDSDAASFEALCRAHIKAFTKGAENYALETNLTKRVGDWQKALIPLLQEEERRPEFDIYRYGDRVISTIRDEIEQQSLNVKQSSSERRTFPEKAVDFRVVTKHCDQYEVCRLFLASLGLSNSGNVVFSAPEGIVASPASLKIKLVNADIDRPMETYLAPSAISLKLNPVPTQ